MGHPCVNRLRMGVLAMWAVLGTHMSSRVHTRALMGSGSTESVIIPALTKVFLDIPSERVPEIRFIATPTFPPNISQARAPSLEPSLLKTKPRQGSWRC